MLRQVRCYPDIIPTLSYSDAFRYSTVVLPDDMGRRRRRRPGTPGRALMEAGGARRGICHAAKHGVLGLTTSAALGYAARGIRGNAACVRASSTRRWSRGWSRGPGRRAGGDGQDDPDPATRPGRGARGRGGVAVQRPGERRRRPVPVGRPHGGVIGPVPPPADGRRAPATGRPAVGPRLPPGLRQPGVPVVVGRRRVASAGGSARVELRRTARGRRGRGRR